MKIIAMVPARIGSTRLKQKNLALLGGKPLISYALDAAKTAGVFERIVLNADHPAFRRIADRHGVEFYRRPAELGSSTTKSDSVVYDFMKTHPAEAVAWVNPTSPLQTGDEIRAAVRYFADERLDSMITVKNEQVHCVYKGEPVNFKTDEVFAQTQDLTPVQPCVYSVMMWRTATFMKAFESTGHALLAGKVGYFPVSKLSAVIIKTEEDLRMAEAMLAVTQGRTPFRLDYEPLDE